MIGMSEASRLRVALQAEVQRGELELSGPGSDFDRATDSSTITQLSDRLRHVWGVTSISFQNSIWEIFKERRDAEAAIQRKYNEFNWFGQPTGEMVLGADTRGYCRHFQQGSIFWLPTWGAHEVHGAIRDKYASMGWDNSYLRYPTTDEIQNDVRYSNFEHGTIYWTADLGAYLLPDISVKVERHQLGAWLHISGRGFTPGGAARFSIEGLEGAVGAKSIGLFTFARSDGTLPDDVWWDGRTWPRGGTATLKATDEVTRRTASYPIPALY